MVAVRDTFMAEFGPLYEQATREITPGEEFFYVVDVGEPSERETRALYETAAEQIDIVTKSFEYFERVEPAVRDAVNSGVNTRVLLLHPDHLSAANREVQSAIVDRLADTYRRIDLGFNKEKLPLRATIADPSLEYETGKAVFQVEEKDVPIHLRKASVTESDSPVAAMERNFELIWDNESVARRVRTVEWILTLMPRPHFLDVQKFVALCSRDLFNS